MDALLSVPEFAGWMIWPATEFVATRALQDGTTAAFDAGMALLARLTTRLSSEFAIRDMLIARPERAIRAMETWTGHDNEHVRRLASEGSRAYLPWAKRVPWLIENPDATRGFWTRSTATRPSTCGGRWRTISTISAGSIPPWSRARLASGPRAPMHTHPG